MQCPAAMPDCELLEPTWSPAGSSIAFVRGSLRWPKGPIAFSLFAMKLTGRRVRRLAGCGSCGEQWGGHLSWSPDGSRIAFSRDSGPHGAQSLWVFDTVSRSLRRLTDCRPAWCADIDPAWAPRAKLILFSRIDRQGSSLYTVRPDGAGLTRITSSAGVARDPQWSPDGREIAFDGRDKIVIANAAGSDQKLLVTGTAGSGPGVPAWSPDGRTLAFFDTPGRSGAFAAEVWTVNTSGSSRRRLYRSSCCVSSWAAPIWSPDGKKIAFASIPPNGTFVIDANGRGLRWLSGASAVELTWQRRS